PSEYLARGIRQPRRPRYLVNPLAGEVVGDVTRTRAAIGVWVGEVLEQIALGVPLVVRADVAAARRASSPPGVMDAAAQVLGIALPQRRLPGHVLGVLRSIDVVVDVEERVWPLPRQTIRQVGPALHEKIEPASADKPRVDGQVR